MTALLEKLIAILAPHRCIVCSNENNVLCDLCAFDVFVALPPECVFCQRPTVDWRVCQKCSKQSALYSVWVAAEYKGVVAELIKLYKFKHAKAAHKPLAQALSSLLPYLQPGTVIVPLPTAQTRVRQRGYDQSVLLAKEVASLRKLKLETPLVRVQSTRQLGANKQQRQTQASKAYQVVGNVKGKYIWLVDDICTTGASLNEAAKLLKKAGAKQVDAVAVAWQKLD